MALALNNLKRVDMPLNKETKPNNIEYSKFHKITSRCRLVSYRNLFSLKCVCVCVCGGGLTPRHILNPADQVINKENVFKQTVYNKNLDV